MLHKITDIFQKTHSGLPLWPRLIRTQILKFSLSGETENILANEVYFFAHIQCIGLVLVEFNPSSQGVWQNLFFGGVKKVRGVKNV